VSNELPPIPPKRYFTIGEVSELCAVKPYVLRYWEQEFTQLRPMKRRGNRRYYQHHEVLLVRRIRELLYEKRFTISGARDQLAESLSRNGSTKGGAEPQPAGEADRQVVAESPALPGSPSPGEAATAPGAAASVAFAAAGPDFDLRRELLAIRRLLSDERLQ